MSLKSVGGVFRRGRSPRLALPFPALIARGSRACMNTSTPKVLICDPIHQDGIVLLRRHATVEIRPGLARAELEQIVGDFDALVVRSATKVPASVIEHGQRLRVIGRAGAGLDSIDVHAARARG